MNATHNSQRKLITALMGIATERQWLPTELRVVERYLYALHTRISELESETELMQTPAPDAEADKRIAELEAEIARLRASQPIEQQASAARSHPQPSDVGRKIKFQPLENGHWYNAHIIGIDGDEWRILYGLGERTIRPASHAWHFIDPPKAAQP